MQAKKTVPFIAIVAGVVVLAAGAGYWLWSGQAAKVEELQNQITETEGGIQTLKRAKIFPEEANVAEIARKNTELAGYLKPAIEAMAARVQSGTNIAGVDFQQQLRRLQEDLYQRAGKTNDPGHIKLPENFAFGFSRYLSAIPAREDTVALTLQLRLTDRIVKMLFASEIQQLDSFQRLPLEDLQTKAGSTESSVDTLPPINVDRADAPYHTVPFVVRFLGTTDSLRAFLNAVARSEEGAPLFIVRYVSVRNPLVTAPTIDSLKAGQPLGGGGGVDPVSGAVVAGTAGSTNALREEKPFIVFGDTSERISCEVRLDYVEWKAGVQPKNGASK